MSRYIDADALKEKIERTYINGIKLSSVNAVIIKIVNDLISDAPTIEAPAWIPCSERLPNRQGYYICTCKDGSKYKRTTTVKWSNGWQLTGARAYWIVLTWMPLPEPWKGADDEEL